MQANLIRGENKFHHWNPICSTDIHYTLHPSVYLSSKPPNIKTHIKQLTLNDWSRGEQWILFTENLNVSQDEVEGNIEIWGKQNSLFPKWPVIKWFVIWQNKWVKPVENK